MPLLADTNGKLWEIDEPWHYLLINLMEFDGHAENSLVFMDFIPHTLVHQEQLADPLVFLFHQDSFQWQQLQHLYKEFHFCVQLLGWKLSKTK